MKRFVSIAGLVLVVALLFVVGAFASSGGFVEGYTVPGPFPEGVDVWVVDGRVFVRDSVVGELVWFCEGECTNSCPYVVTSSTPTPGSESTATPPIDTTATPGPKATKKPKCNRGIGNLDEDCDPGNSSGQGQGGGRPAGEDREEDQGPPGN